MLGYKALASEYYLIVLSASTIFCSLMYESKTLSSGSTVQAFKVLFAVKIRSIVIAEVSFPTMSRQRSIAVTKSKALITLPLKNVEFPNA